MSKSPSGNKSSNTNSALDEFAKRMAVKNNRIYEPLSSTSSLTNPKYPVVPKHLPYPKAPNTRVLTPDQRNIIDEYEKNIKEINIEDDKQKKKKLQKLSSIYYKLALKTGVNNNELHAAKMRADTETGGIRNKTKRKKTKRKKTKRKKIKNSKKRKTRK